MLLHLLILKYIFMVDSEEVVYRYRYRESYLYLYPLDCNMKIIPCELWTVRNCAKVIDLGDNLLEEVPVTIRRLSLLTTLQLTNNVISEENVSWEAMSELHSLAVLDLSQNKLERLPSAVGLLRSLSYLYVAHNNLTSLPPEIEQIERLEVFKANNNRIVAVPSSVGNLAFLTKVASLRGSISSFQEQASSKPKVSSICSSALQALPVF